MPTLARDFYCPFLRSTAFLRGASKLRGMNHVDSRITGEVIGVEGDNLRDSMHLHSCYKPSVVGFLPGNSVVNDEPAPFVIEFWRVTKNGAQFFDAGCYPGGLARREAKPICVHGTSGDRPKFVNVLRNDTYPVRATSQYPESANGLPVFWRISMDTANKDVRIDEDVHLPLVFTGVDILAAECGVGNGWHAL